MNIQDCIENCLDCSAICQETLIKHCLPMGGKHVETDHVKIMLDCIQICQVAADFMRRESDMHYSVCAACADICEECAQSCAQIKDGMEKCVAACRKCAESCSEMGRMKKVA